jgi:20S proteasome alpha/beta subunit
VGMCCRDGVVLGADTRSTGGPLVMDKNKHKIHQVSGSIFCCAAGTSADCDQVTRRAGHHLAHLRIDREFAGEACVDSVATAVLATAHALKEKAGAGRRKQSVLILGGVDALGPALFQIDEMGAPQRVGSAALGSGSTDAIAVMESAQVEWLRARNSSGVESHLFDCMLDISTEEAIPVVRRAVQAGIMNDMGSGSHVDFCTITKRAVKQWRESAVSTWEDDRLSIAPDEAQEGREAAPLLNNQQNVPNRTSSASAFGRLVYSGRRTSNRLIGGKLQEVLRSSQLDELLDVELIR